MLRKDVQGKEKALPHHQIVTTTTISYEQFLIYDFSLRQNCFSCKMSACNDVIVACCLSS